MDQWARYSCTVIYRSTDGSNRTKVYPWTGTSKVPRRETFGGTEFELVALVRTAVTVPEVA